MHRYLHEVLKTSNMLSMIGFVDPAVIGALGCGDVSQRSRVLATRFSSAHPDQIFLIPYNSGNHWMLTIVNVDKETIYFMDPLNRIIIDEEWKQVVNTAIKVLNVKRNRKGRKTPQWIILMGTPKQPTNTECGYFVMRYMKEIIEDKNLEFASKWSKTNDCTYTQNQIDEVRSEWADYVMTNYV
ncbi:hypothetical protein CerSpe_216300 [Prunus speciosa]